MTTPGSIEARLAVLAAKAAAAQRRQGDDINWDRPAALPLWLPRRVAASAVTHLYAGEIATASMCRQLAERMDMPVAKEFLDLQAADEQRHAHLYSHYIAKLGGPDKRPLKVAGTYEQAASWRGAPEAVILAFHGVLEGESMRLQQSIDKWLPCPLFKDISATVARDEARHIAFGRLYLCEALPAMPRMERQEIFRWIRDLWFNAVRSVIGRFAPPGLFLASGGSGGWIAAEWRERLDDLQKLRLFSAEEREEFARL